MPGLSSWAVRRPVIALVAWLVALIAVVGLGVGVGGTLNDSFELPDTESTAAQKLLGELPNAGAANGATARVVWSPAAGSAVDEAAIAKVQPLLESFAALPSVDCVSTPFGPGLGKACPPAQAGPSEADLASMPEDQKAAFAEASKAAQQAMSPVSPDGKVAYATIAFTANGDTVPTADAKAILNGVKALNGPDLAVGANGQVLDFAGQEPPSSEGIGILVAIVILLIAFGSIVAAGMPIVVAIVGLAMGQMAVLVVANFLDVATFAPTLAAMIGLGVGIDYALFVMNRFRQAVLAGHAAKDAAMESVETAGRAVLFAGGTVIIASLVWWDVDRSTLLSDSVHFHHFRDYEIDGAARARGIIEKVADYAYKDSTHRYSRYMSVRKGR